MNPMKFKMLFLMGMLIHFSSTNAQDPEKDAVREVVEGFFKAFHQKDSVGMKQFVGDDVLLQTTGKNKEGKTQFKSQPIAALFKSIVSIPDSIQFEEKLTSMNIQIDRTMANAWVGYEFWLNGKFSHCGINSFQMVDFDGEWKIIYLIDTRGKKGCGVD